MPLQLAVSTWSVHRQLGVTFAQSPEDSSGRMEQTYGPGLVKLVDLPAELTRRGIDRVEICHFQLPSRDPADLRNIGDTFRDAGVTIQTLLIDDGDLTHPRHGARDRDWIASWIDAAAHLGAQNARVIAGKAKPTPETLQVAIDGLRTLGRRGRERKVRVVTENWFNLLSRPKHVHHVLDALDGEVGFLADTGNWGGATKYGDLTSIFARAELSHTKAEFGAGTVLNADDYRRCLMAAQKAGYQGPHTLIFEGDGNEWSGVEIERDFVRAFYAAA
jgi:sugar phosphate isomerase/epimerase